MKKSFVFCSGDQLTDNCLALVEEMLKLKIMGNYYILTTSGRYNELSSSQYEELNKKMTESFGIKGMRIKQIKKNSFIGILKYIFADYIFHTGGIFEKIPILPHQVKVNLWHGMPLKVTGKLVDRNAVFKMSYTLSNGKIFNEPIKKTFDVSDKQLLLLGSPRNDLLKEKNNLSFNKIFDNNQETIVWMPTYRRNMYSEELNGIYIEDNIDFVNLNDLNKLNDFLIEKQVNLLIKVHPMDILNESKIVDECNTKYSKIYILINGDDIFDNIYFYKLLQYSTALITDYSSIYFDYLLLKKPIGIINTDFNQYAENRGIIDEVKEKMTINEITNYDEFFLFIKNISDKQNYDRLIKMTKEQIDYFQTYDSSPNNSKKLLEYLGII